MFEINFGIIWRCRISIQRIQWLQSHPNVDFGNRRVTNFKITSNSIYQNMNFSNFGLDFPQELLVILLVLLCFSFFLHSLNWITNYVNVFFFSYRFFLFFEKWFISKRIGFYMSAFKIIIWQLQRNHILGVEILQFYFACRFFFVKTAR